MCGGGYFTSRAFGFSEQGVNPVTASQRMSQAQPRSCEALLVEVRVFCEFGPG